jgi:hypothetical protein
MISLRNRFLFVHIPKTAGNSIQSILCDYSEDRIVTRGGQDGVERFEVRSAGRELEKHSTLADYYRELGEEIAAGLFKFTCVRNPWDRMISFWFSPHRRETGWDPKKFRKFVEKEVRQLRDYFALPTDAGKTPFGNVDFVMRYERLNEDFRAVCGKLGIPPVELPVLNRSERGGVADYYDDKLSDFIAEIFADEIAYFGYTRP